MKYFLDREIHCKPQVSKILIALTGYRDYFVFLRFRSLLGQTRLFDILNIYLAGDCIFLTYIETLLYLTNECSKDDPLPMKQCTDIFHANDLFCYSHYDGETSKPKGNS